jgi:hypothetical protein
LLGRAPVSETVPTLAAMDSSDVVDPADAALHELLPQLAEHARDPERRENILDLMLTVSAVA